jgi:hypothetical protein
MEKKIVVPIGGDNIPPYLPPSATTPVLTDLTIGTDKFKINDKGEAVDDLGKVIKSKEEIEKLKNPGSPIQSEEDKLKQQVIDNTAKERDEKIKKAESSLIEGTEIELDGKTFVVNKDGNIEQDGKILKTKQELASLLLESEGNREEDYIGTIQKATNLVITDDTGVPIKYDNTVEGLTKYAQDLYANGRTLGATTYEQELFSQFPVLKDVIEHLTLKGSLDGFKEQVDYSSINIEDDEQQHIDIYVKAKTAQGMSANEIADMVNYLKADKKLKDAAITSLSYLREVQKQEKVNRAAAIEQRKKEEDLEIANYWNEVHTVINDKQLVLGEKKFILPEIIKVKDNTGKVVTKTLKDFQEYIEKPLNFTINGQIHTMTQHDYDEYIENTKRTPHNDLFDAYRRFTRYDDSQLIAANVSSNIVKQVIKLKTKASDGGSGTSGSTGKLVLPIK